jgi:glyoxylase-like metal-dependent hydrolase (beta-lactamase superfamily II)/rhodanese-related sulfurtransferase
MTNVISFKHEGLGNSSYLVELPEGGAVVIDPDRRAERYLDAALANRVQISAILETHLHADFVAGARELAAATGAEVYLPEQGGYRFPHNGLTGGDFLPSVGAVIEVLATPGHSPEHLSFLVRSDAAPILFSGGSILPGGAARTDLAGPDLTDELTRDQFRTLVHAFSHLPDETVVYPTHGGGSYCAAGADQTDVTTLGAERAANQWLTMSEAQFLKAFPATFPPAPRYFFALRAFNRSGPRLRRDLPQVQALSPNRLRGMTAHTTLVPHAEGSTVVDLRTVPEYSAGHIAGALSIPLRPAFAIWLGSLVPFGSRLLFVGQPEAVQEAVEESRLIGYENILGYLEGGMESWIESGYPVSSIQLIPAPAAADSALAEAVIIDVREPSEYTAGHIPGAINLPLGLLGGRIRAIPTGREIFVYCGHGERSSSAASILERAGFLGVTNMLGGFSAWQQAGLPVEA